MGAGFKMLSRVLVDVGRSQQTVHSSLRGERDRSDGRSPRAIRRIDDLIARRIEQAAIEGSQANANFLLLESGHNLKLSRFQYLRTREGANCAPYKTVSSGWVGFI